MPFDPLPPTAVDICPICGGKAGVLAAFDPRTGARGVICQSCIDSLHTVDNIDLKPVVPRRPRRNMELQTVIVFEDMNEVAS